MCVVCIWDNGINDFGYSCIHFLFYIQDYVINVYYVHVSAVFLWLRMNVCVCVCVCMYCICIDNKNANAYLFAIKLICRWYVFGIFKYNWEFSANTTHTRKQYENGAKGVWKMKMVRVSSDSMCQGCILHENNIIWQIAVC
jgi:hypothetical protein